MYVTTESVENTSTHTCFYRAWAQQCWRATLILQLCPSVRHVPVLYRWKRL